jgi:glycosyltransferase involved in cell wall biosynthesis
MDMSVLILTKDEEKNIVDVVQNAKKCCENVFIIDSGSVDDTVKLARENGAKVLFRAWDDDFAAQRNFGLQEADTKWVLYLDADERLNDELICSIKEVVGKDEPKQYIIKRKSIAFNQEFNYGVLRPNFVARLFPRESAKWINRVHEKAVCDLPKETLRGHIKHYTYINWEQFLNKMNKYSTLSAQRYIAQDKKCYFFRDVVLRPLWAFIKVYFMQGGFLDGKMGWMLSVSHYAYTMNKYAKLYYLHESKRDFI